MIAGRGLLAVVLCESAYRKTWQDIKKSHHTKMCALGEDSLSPLDLEVSGCCFSGKAPFPFLRGWSGESASLFDVSHMCSIRCQTSPSNFFTCQDLESCASHKFNHSQAICCIIMEHDGMTCRTMFLYKVFFAQKLPKVLEARKVCSSALKEVLDRYRLTTLKIIDDRLETPFLDSVSLGLEKKAEYNRGLGV